MKQLDFYNSADTATVTPSQAPTPVPGAAEPRRDQDEGLQEQFSRQLSSSLGLPLHLVCTENQHRMLSWRREAGHLYVRMHHRFLHAPALVVKAIADLIHGKSTGRQVVSDYIRTRIRDGEPRPARRRALVLRPVGVEHDLREVHRTINARFFSGVSTARVTWGSRRVKPTARHLQFGNYNLVANVITINQRLNARHIPLYVIEFVMYHEILHELLGVRDGGAGRRRQVHPREFRRRERMFPQYHAAKAFWKEHWGVE